ncbi:riboflavin synthase [Asticcacaulis sp. ZE23SCel15]|uniref:riboflavin synthase n=1 Tax=Asticcacaulis sp. ZE23SCel15 TaxID=3059027 RepID=UPI0026604E9D|nr:riboflavin synthase [Asticcacaulis sp. ZE23SCel15]WKL56503.1 riboflavin synthase [Asticcacaulis sp. ZE23SCel15]
MFTGIITDMGEVVGVDRHDGGARFEIRTAYNLSGVDLGASIAHSGCCLTVVSKTDDRFTVDVSNETLSLTTLSQWELGQKINLERALKVGDELGGHIVAGHVDGVGELISVKSDGDSYRLKIRVPRPLHRYIAPKGSIALDGISLTVNEVEDDVFGVNIIPHTWTYTTLSQIGEGGKLNLEIDLMARYAARWRETV